MSNALPEAFQLQNLRLQRTVNQGYGTAYVYTIIKPMTRSPLQRFLFHAILGLMLMVAYPFQALYSGNQNVYFLWGMAKAGIGSLHLDPLLAQTDPFPLFSLLVFGVMKFLHPWVFHLLYWIVNSVYTYAIFGIVHHVLHIYGRTVRLAAFSGLFLLMHCGALWAGLFHAMFDVDLNWVWDSGIVEQGVLRGYLQPSTSGVLLLLSTHLYLQGRPQGVFLSLAAAAMIHANYLFIGAGMGATYLVLFWRDGVVSKGQTVIWAVFSAILVMPQLLYVVTLFLPQSASEAQLLTNAVLQTRDLNIHLDPAMWWSLKTVLQLGVVVVALWLFSSHPVGRLMLMLSLLFGCLSAITLSTDHQTLLSLTPWRISVLLVPVSAMLVAARMFLPADGESLPRGTAALFMMAMVALASFAYFRVFGSTDVQFVSIWRPISLSLMAFGLVLPFLCTSLYTDRAFGIALTLCLSAAAVSSGILEKWMEHRFSLEESYHGLIGYLRSEVKDSDIVLMPTELSNLRMNVPVAVVADDHLVHGLHLPELLDRQHDVRFFFMQSIISRSSIEEMVHHYAFTILVLPLEKEIPTDHPFTEVYRDDHFMVFRR
jgi:hypothetical protein